MKKNTFDKLAILANITKLHPEVHLPSEKEILFIDNRKDSKPLFDKDLHINPGTAYNQVVSYFLDKIPAPEVYTLEEERLWTQLVINRKLTKKEENLLQSAVEISNVHEDPDILDNIIAGHTHRKDTNNPLLYPVRLFLYLCDTGRWTLEMTEIEYNACSDDKTKAAMDRVLDNKSKALKPEEALMILKGIFG